VSKVIRSIVDAEGGISLDYVGFVEGECVAEDGHLGQGLAELGLCVRPLTKQRKDQTGGTAIRTAGGSRLHECR